MVALIVLLGLLVVLFLLLISQKPLARADFRRKQEASKLTLSLHPVYREAMMEDRQFQLTRERQAHELALQWQEFELKRRLAITRIEVSQHGTYLIDQVSGELTHLQPIHKPLPLAKVVEPAQIEGPHVSQVVPTLAELIETRQIVPFEAESILGFTDGQPRRGKWSGLHSFFTVGMSGSGKSSTVSYYVALAVMHGARLIIIDPEAEEEESLTSRLAALEFAFLCQPGTTPQLAKIAIDVAKQEIESPGDDPVVLCIDEFTSIMRGLRGWEELVDPMKDTVEDWAQRGRKRKRTAIVIGQIAKATRTGGTEIRDSMTATFVHRLKRKQARMVLDGDELDMCERLAIGEVLVLLSNQVEAYRMTIPYADPADLVTVAELMMSHEQFTLRSRSTSGEVPIPVFHDVNATRNTDETSLELVWQAKVKRVAMLRLMGRNQRQIIQQVWGVLPGGTKDYANAKQEYQQIIERLVQQEVEEAQ